jgi:hypothetical protein
MSQFREDAPTRKPRASVWEYDRIILRWILKRYIPPPELGGNRNRGRSMLRRYYDLFQEFLSINDRPSSFSD